MSGENWYDRHVLPWMLDLACGSRRIREQRDKVVPRAQGRVLEIGIGTGLNLAHYDPTRVTSIVGVDPALQMHRLARRRLARTSLQVELVGLSAERLPLEDRSFDTVVCTFTLCTIADPLAALKEMRRVLRPDGRLLYAEHGQAPEPGVRRWQQRLQPLWGRIAGGCHLGRDIEGLLQAGGFTGERHHGYLPGPQFASYMYWGEASKG
jgi:ubiquinone/menaquinone biosynthesis C-methylase UbiE